MFIYLASLGTPTSIPLKFTLTKAITVAILNSTLLYCEPVANSTIIGLFTWMAQLQLFNISSDKYFTHIPIITFSNDFE